MDDLAQFGNFLLGLAMMIGLIWLYMLPSRIAKDRRLKNADSIFWVNLFLGCTTIGWVVCLAWATAGTAARERT